MGSILRPKFLLISLKNILKSVSMLMAQIFNHVLILIMAGSVSHIFCWSKKWPTIWCYLGQEMSCYFNAFKTKFVSSISISDVSLYSYFPLTRSGKIKLYQQLKLLLKILVHCVVRESFHAIIYFAYWSIYHSSAHWLLLFRNCWGNTKKNRQCYRY